MNWLLSQVAQTLGARMVGADVALTAVSTDTRGVAAGQLFIALRGARFDAHDFLVQPLRQRVVLEFGVFCQRGLSDLC